MNLQKALSILLLVMYVMRKYFKRSKNILKGDLRLQLTYIEIRFKVKMFCLLFFVYVTKKRDVHRIYSIYFIEITFLTDYCVVIF